MNIIAKIRARRAARQFEKEIDAAKRDGLARRRAHDLVVARAQRADAALALLDVNGGSAAEMSAVIAEAASANTALRESQLRNLDDIAAGTALTLKCVKEN